MYFRLFVSKFFDLENPNENKKILVDYYKGKCERIFNKLIQERRDNNYKISNSSRLVYYYCYFSYFCYNFNNYYKILIHPISFCIPEENILVSIPSKVKPFGNVIPGQVIIIIIIIIIL